MRSIGLLGAAGAATGSSETNDGVVLLDFKVLAASQAEGTRRDDAELSATVLKTKSSIGKTEAEAALLRADMEQTFGALAAVQRSERAYTADYAKRVLD